ncbi:hypothetical protein A5675_24550 [Mycobacterium malmoense]|nr:hypothetical protein A5675_24550 [Mycobacterium malmoense]
MVVEDLPACIEHLNPLSVLLGEMALAIAFVEKPQQCRVHRLEQPSVIEESVSSGAVEHDLTGL